MHTWNQHHSNGAVTALAHIGQNYTKPVLSPELVRHMEMSKQVNLSIRAAREAGHNVQINQHIPTVCVYHDEDTEYFFQGQEATELLEEADKIADLFGIWASEALLYMSQSW